MSRKNPPWLVPLMTFIIAAVVVTGAVTIIIATGAV